MLSRWSKVTTAWCILFWLHQCASQETAAVMDFKLLGCTLLCLWQELQPERKQAFTATESRTTEEKDRRWSPFVPLGPPQKPTQIYTEKSEVIWTVQRWPQVMRWGPTSRQKLLTGDKNSCMKLDWNWNAVVWITASISRIEAGTVLVHVRSCFSPGAFPSVAKIVRFIAWFLMLSRKVMKSSWSV